MALANGTYVVVSALNTQRAIDVTNASDAAGANVWLYTLNYTSAQYVTVTGTYPKQVIRFPLTGKVLTVANATVKNGANVIQHTGNNGNSQAWKIIEDGNTITYSSPWVDPLNGTVFPSYTIRTALNNDYVLDLIGNTSAVGTNVQIHQRYVSRNGQRWAFVPVPLLPKGNYRFISVLDQNSCIAAANSKDGAGVKVVGVDEVDRLQIWSVAGSTTATTIKNFKSGCYLNLNSTTAGSLVSQKAKTNGDYTSWLLTVAGSKSYNGATYSTICIEAKAGPSRILDVANGGAKVESDVRVTAKSSSVRPGQQFIAVPVTPISTGIPTPSALGASYSVGAQPYTNIWGRGSIYAYPSWVCGYKNYQIRYRWRKRKVTAGDDVYGGWTAWQSKGGSTANGGWVNTTKENCVPTLTKDPAGVSRRYCWRIGFGLTTTGYDKVQFQYQVRAVATNNNILYCGPMSTKNIYYSYRPQLTVSGFSFTPDGLAINYTSDQKRDNNDLTVYSVKCMHGGTTYTIYDGKGSGYPINDIPYKGSAVLPLSKISYLPTSGDTITAVVRFTNVDGAYLNSKQTVTGTVTTPGKSLSFTPTFEITSGLMLHADANIGGADKYALWIDYGAVGGGYSKYGDATGEWHIPVLFGRSYTAYILVKKLGVWNIKSAQMSAVTSDAYLFNFENASSGEQDWTQILINTDQPPAFNRSVAYDSSTHMTNGNALEVVHFGSARKEALSISGIVPRSFSIPNSTVAKVEALVNAHYAWLRMPNTSHGSWRVAIESCDFDYSEYDFVRVDLKIRRINNPADW